MYPCPCCGFLTVGQPGAHDICDVCFWQDDPVQSSDPRFAGGANDLSLVEARANFARIGAGDPANLGSVRPPRPEEIPRSGGQGSAPGRRGPVSPPQ